MDIIKSQKPDLSEIVDLISKCITHMESQGIYQWDEFYPNKDIIENDIKSDDGYVIKDNGRNVAFFAINEEQPEEYSQINWHYDGQKILVVHRLLVHPEFQGKGMAKKILQYIDGFASKNNYSSIRLEAYSGNEKALKLYEHSGYQKSGETYFPRRNLPFYCYEKII